jgi:hypothetical protein
MVGANQKFVPFPRVSRFGLVLMKWLLVRPPQTIAILLLLLPLRRLDSESCLLKLPSFASCFVSVSNVALSN